MLRIEVIRSRSTGKLKHCTNVGPTNILCTLNKSCSILVGDSARYSDGFGGWTYECVWLLFKRTALYLDAKRSTVVGSVLRNSETLIMVETVGFSDFKKFPTNS